MSEGRRRAGACSVTGSLLHLVRGFLGLGKVGNAPLNRSLDIQQDSQWNTEASAYAGLQSSTAIGYEACEGDSGSHAVQHSDFRNYLADHGQQVSGIDYGYLDSAQSNGLNPSFDPSHFENCASNEYSLYATFVPRESTPRLRLRPLLTITVLALLSWAALVGTIATAIALYGWAVS